MTKTIAVLGGTGKEGSALAVRWQLNGYDVIIGSRSKEKAQQAAEELNEKFQIAMVGMANEDAARVADIVVLSVPYSAHKSTLESVKPYLGNKILVDVTVPLVPPKVRVVHLPEGLSAGLEAQAIVEDDVRVVSAFQNISPVKLRDPEYVIACDVLICGDDPDAKAEVIALAKSAGMRGYDAGVLANSIAVEALTPVLIHINKTYGVKNAGIQITGIDQS